MNSLNIRKINSFSAEIFVADLKLFLNSLRYFMEKVYRKFSDKAPLVL